MPLRAFSCRSPIVVMLLCLVLFAQLPIQSFAEVTTAVTIEAVQKPAATAAAIAVVPHTVPGLGPTAPVSTRADRAVDPAGLPGPFQILRI
jgi:hypothetical protein